MRIAVIATLKKGLESFVYRELLIFSRLGHSIRLFPTKYRPGLYNPRPEWDLHLWHAAQVILRQPIYLLSAPVQYIRLLREALTLGATADFFLAFHFARFMNDVDVIYATFGDHKLFVGYFCKRITGRPLVVTIHAYELYQNPNPRLFEKALGSCDQIITVTEYNRELLANRWRVAAERVEVVRINVDTEDYCPKKKFVLLIVAFFVERKGHEVLFDAIKQLNQEDIEVWVVGDEGREKPVDVRRMVSRMGLEDRVAFFGNLSGTALKALFRACDAFCLPCRTDQNGIAEGFPTAVAEAMAFGKPVITTRHVEIPRIVQEILVDENDAVGLALAIRRAYDCPALCRRLGDENREIARGYFSSSNGIRTAWLMKNVIEQYSRRDPKPGGLKFLIAKAKARNVGKY